MTSPPPHHKGIAKQYEPGLPGLILYHHPTKVLFSMQHNIHNLIFDFGKVLVDYDFEAFFSRFIPDQQRRWTVMTILYSDSLPQRLDRGDYTFEQLMQELILRYPDFADEILIFSRHYTEIVTAEVSGMRTLLTQLKSEGYHLYGLTNWCSKVHDTMRQYDIFRLLNGHIISSEVHTIKPEPAIYQCLLDRYHLHPSECVFTDDKAENVEAAIRMGMHGIIFHDANQYERELRMILQTQK